MKTRDERYQAMQRYQAQEDRRNCTDGGPYHHNQYFDRNKGYWICPDCGATSRQRSLEFLGSVLVMVVVAFGLLFLLAWLGIVR